MVERAVLARALPSAVYVFFIVGAALRTRLGADAHQRRGLYSLKVGAVPALLLPYRRQYTELAPRTLALTLAAGVLVLILWISLNAFWMVIGHGAGFDPLMELFWRPFPLRSNDSPVLPGDPARVSYQSSIIRMIIFCVEHNLWLAGIVAGAAYPVL